MIKIVNSGYQQSVFIGKEGAYGKSTTINSDIGLVQTINPTEVNNIIKVRKLGGSRDYAALVPGKFELGGTFDYLLQNGRFLKYAIGEDSATTSTIDSGPKITHAAPPTTGTSYHHVMGSAASPDVNNFPSFNLEYNDSETTVLNRFKRIYTGARVNTLAIKGEVDTPVTVTVDWMAQSVHASTLAATAVTTQTVDPYVFYQGEIYLTGGPITGSNSPVGTVAELRSFTVTVNNNMEAVWYISGTTNIYQCLRGPKLIVPKGRDYSANVGFDFSSMKQFHKFLGAANATTSQGTLNKYQVGITLVRVGGPTRSTCATNDWMRIVLGSCTFDNANIPGNPEDIVKETYDLMVKSAKVHVFDRYSTAY